MISILNREKLKKNYWIYILAISILIIPNLAQAAAFDAFIGRMIAYIIYFLMIFPLGLVLKLELWILPLIAEYNNFINVQGVIDGWTILRDLSNMLFIIVFLVIAFATILKIRSYGYEALLKKFLIVAILINFSRTIVGFVIDIFQIIMLTFVAAIKDIAAGNVVTGLGIGNWDQFSNTIEQQSNFLTVVAAALLLAIMMLITVIVIGMFIVALTVRIVQIWIYVVLSPLAFFAYTFPAGQKYFNDWVSKLGKTLLVGPVIAFFLWFSFTMMSSNLGSGFGEGNLEEVELTGLTTAANPGQMINFIIGISLLIASLKMAQELGAAGASVATGLVDKAKSSAKRVAWSGKSGEGGIKGGLSRIRSGAAGGTVDLGSKIAGIGMVQKLAKTKAVKYSGLGMVGKAVGAGAQRVSMRAAGKERLRVGRKAAYVTKKAEEAGIDKSEMASYLDKGAGIPLGTGVATRTARAKSLAERGQFPSDDDAIRSAADLRKAGDIGSLNKIQDKRADAFDPKVYDGNEEKARTAAQDVIKDKGVKTFDNWQKDSIIDKNGQPTQGAQIIAEEMLSDPSISAADITKSLGNLNAPIAKALKKTFASIDVGKSKPLKDNGKIDRESRAGKKAILGLNSGDKDQTNEAYQALRPQAPPKLAPNATPKQTKEHKNKEKRYKKYKDDPTTFNKSLAKEVDKKTLKKMPKNSPTFLAAVNGMPSGEIPSLVKDMEIKDVRIVVEQQVKAGKIEDMILSPVTRPGVTKEQKNRPENIERLKGVTVPSAAEDAAKEMSEAAKEMSKAAKEIGKTSKGGGEKKKTNKI